MAMIHPRSPCRPGGAWLAAFGLSATSSMEGLMISPGAEPVKLAAR
jgi:hypothetical protein